MVDNMSKWGKATAAKRYARGGALSSRTGSGPFPGQSEKDFVEGEEQTKRNRKIQGDAPTMMGTDTDTRDVDRANSMADPEKKDRGGY